MSSDVLHNLKTIMEAHFSMDWLDSIPSAFLQKDLDGLWARQKVISDNMANIETPGYKEKNISFENQLKSKIDSIDGSGNVPDEINGIEDTKPLMTENARETYRADNSGVDLEQQMVSMARTSLNYSYSLQTMGDYFTRLKAAITGSSK
mgnify:FL=1